MPSHLVPKDKAKTSHDEISFKEAWPISTVVGAGSGLSRGQAGCRLISSLLKQFRAMPYRNTRMPWPCSAQCPKRDIASINPDPSFECRWARDLESCTSFFFAKLPNPCCEFGTISTSFTSFSLFLLVWSCVHCPPEIRVWWHGQIWELWLELENVACDLLRPLEFCEISQTFLKLSTQHPWNTCSHYFRTWLYYFFRHLFHPCWSHLSLSDHAWTKRGCRDLGVPLLFSSLEGSYHIQDGSMVLCLCVCFLSPGRAADDWAHESRVHVRPLIRENSRKRL